MAETRILIVEDEDLAAGEIRSVLTHLGYAVAGRAVSGDEAIAAVEAAQPDLVLMDITLQGGLDGIDAAEIIRDRRHVPIVYLTAHDDETTVQQATLSDPFGYVLKPFKPRELHIAIEMALYRHRTDQRLRELNAQLQEVSRHKSDFLANMSHELRTPLNAMIGYTSLTLNALKDSLPPEHLQNLTRAEQASRVLLQLINDVLDFSKIEAGRLETFIEDVDLFELLEDVVITAEGLLSGKAVEFIADFAPDLPTLASDYTRLKQILDNLVGNAIKFTENGHVALRAHVAADAAGMIDIGVDDTGCGMSPEVLEHVFELFRQADGSIKKKFSGTGLGLAISKRLSEMLGISIAMTSAIGQGTSFRLRLPARLPDEFQADSAQAVRLAEHAGAAGDAANHARPGAPAADAAGAPARELPENGSDPAVKALILCCGHSALELALKRQLGNLPLEVVRATTARECRQHLARRPVWAIVVEAGEDGCQALAQFEADALLKDVPVITAPPHGGPHGGPHGPSVGSVDYLEKPVDHRLLLNTVTRMTRAPQGRILVVDDDPNVREIYDRILTAAGYVVHAAGDGDTALGMLREHDDVRVILLDLMMPRMNGFQMLEQIRQHPVWQRIPVLVVTAKTLSEQERRMLRRSAHVPERKEEFAIRGVAKPVTSLTQAIALAGVRSVLVIDDNAMNVNLMVGVFETSGYVVYEATSARQGLAVARKVRPDAIVMDLAMPDMDGFEATEILKRDPETADITVIACSAFATGDYKARALQAGCEGYITKPIEPNRLVEQVTRLILNSKIRRKMRQLS